ncbi:hypothetical protein [Tautonia rosea]|uniref:hypothetical protein n=1 Tax=Tautonia rosea TaxID=2728037 RepID=UPI00147582CC|nr:hypothetical protein [Tautonia rosea]
MEFIVPTDRWEDIDAFYEELIEDYGWRQEPMRAFASWLASGPYGQVLVPSTSHEALGLSTVSAFEDRLKRPMVFVLYDGHRRRFLVRYLGPDLQELRRESVDAPDAPEVFARILDWLGLPR